MRNIQTVRNVDPGLHGIDFSQSRGRSQALGLDQTTNVEASPLLLVSQLLDAVDKAAIKVCYWKSACHVFAALAGEKDLDLLVARRDQHRVIMVLLTTGFKAFPVVPHRDHPSVSSYVGYDVRSGKLVHVHLHMRLVAGHSLLKSFRLPWEDTLMARAVRNPAGPLAVLDAAADVLMLLIRATLDMDKTDAIVRRDWTYLMERYRADISKARAETSPAEVAWLASRLLGEIPGRHLTAALYDSDPLAQRHAVKRLLAQSIASHRLYGSIEAALRSFARTAGALLGRFNKHRDAPRPWHRRAPGGGLVIAIVGLDGSGKSTMVAMVRQWLGAEVDVMPIYFGTGDGRPSLLLAPFKMLVPLAERLFRKRPSGSSHGHVTNKRPGLAYSAAMTLWATIVAMEKRGKLKRARRAASRGMVVVADRYPQSEILTFNDGPLLHRLRYLPAPLRRFEQQSYDLAAALPPDLVIKLVIGAATATQREPMMDRWVIAQRIDEFASLAFAGAQVVSIDAEQPLVSVIGQVKQHVWDAL